MYTALQRIALTQAIGFKHFKNPVLLPPEPVALRVLLHHLARSRCWRASLGPSVLGCNHHRPLTLARDFLQPLFAGYGWGQGMVATGAVGAVAAVSGGNCEQCVLFCCNQNRLLP